MDAKFDFKHVASAYLGCISHAFLCFSEPEGSVFPDTGLDPNGLYFIQC